MGEFLEDEETRRIMVGSPYPMGVGWVDLSGHGTVPLSQLLTSRDAMGPLSPVGVLGPGRFGEEMLRETAGAAVALPDSAAIGPFPTSQFRELKRVCVQSYRVIIASRTGSRAIEDVLRRWPHNYVTG
jgi:hypothetical protein